MTLASMTGFARTEGTAGPWRLTWELKSVNARGLDVRLRLQPPLEAIEPEVRQRLAQRVKRGTIQASLTGLCEAANPQVRINQGLLSSLMAAVAGMKLPEAIAPATLDGLLGLRGIVEVLDGAGDEATAQAARQDALALFDSALDALLVMRQNEGTALKALLLARLERIEALTEAADRAPARKPEAIKARLAQALELLAGNANFDQARLHQEALLLAAKADIREELDRLIAHVGAARGLLEEGGAVGRRLDFLAQELSREANTLCAKANDLSLTELGLELRVEIEQLREQVQNLE